jgi:hypothetical protein
MSAGDDISAQWPALDAKEEKMRHNSSTAEEGLASEQQKYLSVICI